MSFGAYNDSFYGETVALPCYVRITNNSCNGMRNSSTGAKITSKFTPKPKTFGLLNAETINSPQNKKTRDRQQMLKVCLGTEKKFLRNGSAGDWTDYWTKKHSELVD